MTKLPPFVPMGSNYLEDRRIKRLNKDIPNCSGLGMVMGLYFHLLKEPEMKASFDDIDIIADELRTSIPMLTTVITSYNLFEIIEDSTGKKFFSHYLNQQLEPYYKKCEQNKINAQIGAAKRKKAQEKQLIQLKEYLSDNDSSQRSLNECSANIKEEKRRKENIKDSLFLLSKKKREFILDNMINLKINYQINSENINGTITNIEFKDEIQKIIIHIDNGKVNMKVNFKDADVFIKRYLKE